MDDAEIPEAEYRVSKTRLLALMKEATKAVEGNDPVCVLVCMIEQDSSSKDPHDFRSRTQMHCSDVAKADALRQTMTRAMADLEKTIKNSGFHPVLEFGPETSMTRVFTRK